MAFTSHERVGKTLALVHQLIRALESGGESAAQ